MRPDGLNEERARLGRRDLLKCFGIGTIITPAAGEGGLAELIEVPRVKILEPKVATVLDLSKINTVSINIETVDGSIHSFRGGTIRGGYCPYGKGMIPSDKTLHFDVAFSQSDGLSPLTRMPLGRIVGEGSL